MTAMLSDRYGLRGEITIFLALILSSMLGLITVLISSARYRMIRMNTETLTDTALHSCFGEYDRKLFNRYDLIFIDSSYRGEDKAGADNVIRHFTEYIQTNTDQSDTGATGDWYGQDITGADTAGIVYASDDTGFLIKRQACEYVEMNGIDEYTDVIGANAPLVYKGETDDFMSGWDEALSIADSYGLPLYDPGHEVRKAVMEEDEFLTGFVSRELSFSDLVSVRKLTEGNSLEEFGNDKGSDEQFIEYIMDKFGCYTAYSEEQQLIAEIEYIIHGGKSDRDNMKSVIRRLLMIREKDNLVCIRGDAARVNAAYRKAEEAILPLVIAEGLPPDPGLIEAVRDSIIYAWAYAESTVDVSRLLNKGRCPVRKRGSDIYLCVDDITGFRSFLNKTGGRGLSYREFLALFLSELKDKTRRLRCMDIIEGNMRSYCNGEFRIDGCVGYLRVKAQISSRYGYDLEIIRDCRYEDTR